MRRLPWMQIVAYALLALAVAATALAFASLRVLNDQRIPGAGPGYRYCALGMLRSTGPDFGLDSRLGMALGVTLPKSFGFGTAAAWQEATLLSGPGEATREKIHVEMVAGDTLQALHLRPLVGRLLTLEDIHQASPVVVIGETLARRLFGSAATAVGRTLLTAPHGRFTVVGVLPAGFHGINEVKAQAWFPFTDESRVAAGAKPMVLPKGGHQDAVLVLTGLPGVLSFPEATPVPEVRAQLERAFKRLPPGTLPQDVLGLVMANPYSPTPMLRVASARRTTLYLDLAVASLGLTIVNLFTLQWLSLLRCRGVVRMERVLGATRAWQLRRQAVQMLRTSVAMIIASAVFACLGLQTLRHLLAHELPWTRLNDATVIAPMAWLLPLVVLVAILAQGFPLLLLLGREQIDASRSVESGRFDRSVGRVVITVEVLLAAIVSLAAAWALRYAIAMREADLGMLDQPSNYMEMRFNTQQLALINYANATHFAATLLSDLRKAVPHHDVAMGPMPARNGGEQRLALRAGRSVMAGCGDLVSDGWVHAIGGHLLGGKDFSGLGDHTGEALVDSTVALQLFGSPETAIGKTIAVGEGGQLQSLRIIGVFAPMAMRGPSRSVCPMILESIGSQASWIGVSWNLFISHQMGASQFRTVLADLRRLLHLRYHWLVIGQYGSTADLRARLTKPQLFQAEFFVTIALFAWAIALSGVAAHLRLFLAMRKRLTAIRSALGAGPLRLYREVVLGTLALAAAGVLLALLAAPWLAAQFAFLSGAQVAAFGAATWLALGVLLLAVFAVVHFPARRAAHGEPAESLHEL